MAVPQASEDVNSSTPLFEPYVPDGETVRELTWSAILLGSLLGIVFGASSLYLFLKVGMTVSASIPVAVLSITIFRAIGRATILENNIVQTAGSAGESIAFGVGASMPALLLLGYPMDWSRVLLVSVLGGVLGILMMIPLRKAFIVKQHGSLPYPEGTACAKILVAGERGGSSARTVFTGFGIAAVYKFLMEAMHLWNKSPSREITGVTGYSKGVVSCDMDPALLGVGYIVGTRTANTMVGGSLLTALVIIPMIAYFGSGLTSPLPPATGPGLLGQMKPGEINANYARYIGAGAVATGGIISMLRALPMIIGSITGSFRALGSRGGASGSGRTQRDLPLWLVGLGCAGLLGAIAATGLIPTNTTGRLAGAGLILLFGFLFVTVSSRITGEIGSSSNPISGMTIATLLMTCLIFYLVGWVDPQYRLVAISIAGIVCIASSNGGTTAQDLKTGYLVGATPWKQQIAIGVGAITSALVIGGTLIALNGLSEIVTRKPENLPAAGVLAPVADLAETEVGSDGKTYKVWRVSGTGQAAEPGIYRADPETGAIVERVDPGIGGVLEYRDEDTEKRDKVEKYNPPQPRLFATIIEGVLGGKLPWGLVLIGAGISIVMFLGGISPLAFAVGVYLPLSTTFPIFLGGVVRGLVDRARKLSPEESDASPAVLMSSGLIAGASLVGIILATLEAPVGWIQTIKNKLDLTQSIAAVKTSEGLNWPAMATFGALMIVLLVTGLRGPRTVATEEAAEAAGPAA